MRSAWLDRMPDVVARRQAGQSYDEIGQHYGVRRERIRQVLAKYRPRDAAIRSPRGKRLAAKQQRAGARRAAMLTQYAAGGTVTQIACQHGVSRVLVDCAVRSAGLRRPSKVATVLGDVLRLEVQGLSQTEIAARTGLSQSYVSGLLVRHGVRRSTTVR